MHVDQLSRQAIAEVVLDRTYPLETNSRLIQNKIILIGCLESAFWTYCLTQWVTSLPVRASIKLQACCVACKQALPGVGGGEGKFEFLRPKIGRKKLIGWFDRVMTWSIIECGLHDLSLFVFCPEKARHLYLQSLQKFLQISELSIRFETRTASSSQ